MVDGAGSVPDGAVVIKVAVVDDGPLVLDGLTTILGAIADIEVIATATDGGRRDRPRRTTRWGSRCAVARCAHAPYGLVYPESELLFDHREAGALELHVLGQQPSGADGDVNLPRGDTCESFTSGLRLVLARDEDCTQAELLSGFGNFFVVLLDEHTDGCHEGCLVAAFDGLQYRVNRHLGFPGADVARCSRCDRCVPRTSRSAAALRSRRSMRRSRSAGAASSEPTHADPRRFP